jgi:glycosyltransferase involved in cell wall biosynthesis
MSERRYRVLAIASHPVQYAAPIFRLMAQHPHLDFQVAYCSMRGAEAAHDAEFGRSVKWDVPLLDGYAWTHVPNHGSGADSFFGLRNPGLWNWIRQGRFDAVLCYTGYRHATFWISLFAARATRTAFLFGTDTVALTPLDGRMWKRPVKRFTWPLLFRLADQVIVPSSGTRELMLSLGIPEQRVTLTPYVVENEWWIAQSASVNRPAVRQAWEASEDDMVVLFCAKLQPWKRPRDLLRAFAEAELSQAVLVFAGDGPLRAELASAASSLGVAKRVRFLGFVNQTQLPSIYTAADLLVLPSEYDAFGVVVNEAMLCGCPVVASDRVGAGRDLIQNGRTGFVYPCGDQRQLATLLRRLAANDPAPSELGRLARIRMQSWSPRESIEATVKAIESAVSRIRRSAIPSRPFVAAKAADSSPHKISE